MYSTCLIKLFFYNSCLSNEANAHSPPYTATLLVEIICNVKTGKEKKKNVYLYLRFYSHTPTVYNIFKISVYFGLIKIILINSAIQLLINIKYIILWFKAFLGFDFFRKFILV